MELSHRLCTCRFSLRIHLIILFSSDFSYASIVRVWVTILYQLDLFHAVFEYALRASESQDHPASV